MSNQTREPVLQPVVQKDPTGCALASVAALAGQKYAAVKKKAGELKIAVTDPRLWSDTQHIRRLLAHFQIPAGKQRDFVSWNALPARALLAIKWHQEKSGPAWHWVVFVRDASGAYILDPKKSLRTNKRTDFGRIKPKWFISINETKTARTS